ncbi:MAG: hypothetical protein ACK535_13370 [Cyanobacteriota bacterium]
MTPLPPLLTPRQKQRIEAPMALLQSSDHWHGGLPVLVLDRCWLRLEAIAVEELANRLPPDTSREAPELSRYSQLIEAGYPSWDAQQCCWQEFGAEACQQALRRFWAAKDRGNNGWTFARYLQLLADYRQRFHDSPRPLPLLVLARADGGRRGENHGLFWLRPEVSDSNRPMRHTCA